MARSGNRRPDHAAFDQATRVGHARPHGAARSDPKWLTGSGQPPPNLGGGSLVWLPVSSQ